MKAKKRGRCQVDSVRPGALAMPCLAEIAAIWVATRQ